MNYFGDWKTKISMCLSNCKKIEVKEDVVCYKVFRVKRQGLFKKVISSPIIDCIWNGKRGELGFYNPMTSCGGTAIEGRAFHSFKTEDGAVKYANYLDEYLTKDSKREWMCVYKCVIPKGTNYLYEGDNVFSVGRERGWASEKLNIIKCVYKVK